MQVINLPQHTIPTPTPFRSSVLFEQMNNIGAELIAAIKAELTLAVELRSADATDVEKWRAARQAAEMLEEKYSVVFAEWLGAIRVETQLTGDRRHKWAPGIHEEQSFGIK